MNPQIKKRLARTVFLSGLALLIGAAIAYIQVQSAPAVVVNGDQSASVPGVALNAAFSLIDQDGKPVTEKTYPGYKIVYFGFTSCPMVCPTELQKIAKIMKALGAKSDLIQPLFITTDPERDTAKVMKQYVAQFHPRIIGLTGTPEQIKAAESNFKVYAAKARTQDATDYTIDHSSFIYLIGPGNDLASIYRTEDTAEAIAADVKNKI